MKYNTKGLNSLSKQLNEFVKKVGFNRNNIPLIMMLIHSEISEAFEAFRKDKFACIAEYKHGKATNFEEDFKTHIKDTFEDEIADSIIRLLDLCGFMDIDIEFHINEKMKFNETRGYKYGNKKF